MSSARRRLPFGAEVLDGARTRFRLWAPDAEAVDLVLGDRESVAMSTRDGDWFEATCDAPPGTRYRYRIDGKDEVPSLREQASPAPGAR